MHSLIKSILIVGILSIFTTQGFSRGNPIMVIELNCSFDDLVETGFTSALPNSAFVFPCDNGSCPEGYTQVYPDGCYCIPDCAYADSLNEAGVELGFENAFGECPDCDEENLEWNENDQICSCNVPDVSFDNCGCPPWLSVDFQATDGDYTSATCIVPLVECYFGDIDFEFLEEGCSNGPTSTTETVKIRITQANGEKFPPGIALPIEELLNCNFADNSDIILELDEQAELQGFDVALVADENGCIDLTFTRDITQNDGNSNLIFDIEGEEIFMTIGPCPLPEPIPTLSTWMIITLGLIMAISGLVFVKRKEVRAFIGMF